MFPVQGHTDKVYRLQKKAGTLFPTSLVLSVRLGTLRKRKGFNLTYRQSDTTLGLALMSPKIVKVANTYCQISKTMERQRWDSWAIRLQEKCQSQKLLVQDHICLPVSLDICTCTSLQLVTWKRVPWVVDEEQHQSSSNPRSSTASLQGIPPLLKVLVWQITIFLWIEGTRRLSQGVEREAKGSPSREHL